MSSTNQPLSPPTSTAVQPPDPESHADSVSHFCLVLDQAEISHHVLHYAYQGAGTAESPFLVELLPGDPFDPMAFPKWRKWTITFLLAIASLAVAFASTAYSSGMEDIAQQFRVSSEVALLGLSLFILGLAVGPLLWAPLSEEYGRQYLFIGTYTAHVVFNAGAAAAQNIETLIILRFFAAFFGAAPYTNSNAVLADMFPASERGLAMTLFGAAPFLGPALGPIAGGFLGAAGGWRWIQGLMASFTGVSLILCTICVPETYAPVLLRRRAAKLSKITGKVYVSSVDAHQSRQSVGQVLRRTLLRPWILLFREPIVLLTAIYLAVIYGTLYLFFAAFPIVYQYQRGWPAGVSGLAFSGTAVGMAASILYVAAYDNKRYARLVTAGGGTAPPEARLPVAIIGSVWVTVGLFWFAWTNGRNVHWIVSIMASGFFAAGMVFVFVGIINYLIDSYVVYAASVLAANTVIRSLFGAAFPLFTTQMYKNIGIHWASSVPAFLALGCLPVPFLFYRYGESIRAKCKYAAEAAVILAKMRTRREVVPEGSASIEYENRQTGETVLRS
ncbi:major facilitator superfamily transporter [Dactylonectria macrodidyma]|uniref:Major facilitator superfamily transporter n=1 Tax=Dactylonectria macrodidyma TaxID=307937 RepID=A0A9P9IY18_9HYPO|nr:major facilitator superfamily transporter [Dactylonectria macrodidyma]